jgi:hypothetical protein
VNGGVFRFLFHDFHGRCIMVIIEIADADDGGCGGEWLEPVIRDAAGMCQGQILKFAILENAQRGGIESSV